MSKIIPTGWKSVEDLSLNSIIVNTVKLDTGRKFLKVSYGYKLTIMSFTFENRGKKVIAWVIKSE